MGCSCTDQRGGFVWAAGLAVAVAVGLWLSNRQPDGTPPAGAAEAAAPVSACYGGTPERNMANTTAKGIAAEWKSKGGEQKNVKWSAQLGTLAYGGPVIAGGKVFVGTNNENPRDPKIQGDKGVVMCFNAADGTFLWQAVHDKIGVEANDWSKQGVASTPAVDGDRVYYVSNRCEVICASVEPLKGTTQANILWRLDMIKDLKVYPRFLANSSPLVVGDLVYVVTGNGVDDNFKVPDPQAPSFIAVDKKTGKVKWAKSYPGAKVMEGQWTNPAYAIVKGKPQVVFPGGDGWIYSLDPATGEVIWKFDGNPKKSVYKPSGRGDRAYFLATPVIHDNKVYVGTGLNPEDGAGVGHLWCIDMTKTGDVSPRDDGFDPKAAVNKASALVWHFGGKTKDGGNREFVFGRTLSTCAIHDGLLYVADFDGFFYCLDANTGKPLWDHDLKTGVWSSPYYADGKVFIGDDDGDVLVFAHGKEKKLLATNEMDRPVKGPVVAAGDVLYVLTDSGLYAIQKK